MKGIDRRIGASMARQGRRDTKEDIAWRTAHNDVLRQVAAEHALRPPVTAENVDAELAWQAARIKELMAGRGYR